MREQLLEFLEKDSRLTAAELAVMTGQPEDAVAREISAMTKEHVICGFNTLVNWDKTEREFVTALIEVRVTPQRGQGFDSIAARIYRFEEVKAVYLMSGGFDLTVIIDGRNIKEIAHFVTDKLATLDSVLSTATHFVLKKYKDYGIILEKDGHTDERMIVSP
ncbi:MAG: Lrp/AsnC family transcriptional regulator [Clostridiales bacterium]|nr:Lrp/AsnC family transcriptional regulator [Clostridiales bacterium]